jgi:hypothetical protein
VQTWRTFSANYPDRQLWRDPTVLVDQVGHLYDEGFRHIIYLAQAPYTSTVHVTTEVAELYFFSEEIIRRLKQVGADLHIYPLFFDRYDVVKLEGFPEGQVHSMYVEDTTELTQLLRDPRKQTVMFFNLFNGRAVKDRPIDEEPYYNGVISYSTLLNMYTGILDDADLRAGLIQSGQLKSDLLNGLTLLHFARYEAAEARTKPITIKLDPYTQLIGTDSVTRRGECAHMTGTATFYPLAFLTEVRDILNRDVPARDQDLEQAA